MTWFLSSLDIPDAALPEALEAGSLKNYNLRLLGYNPIDSICKTILWRSKYRTKWVHRASSPKWQQKASRINNCTCIFIYFYLDPSIWLIKTWRKYKSNHNDKIACPIVSVNLETRIFTHNYDIYLVLLSVHSSSASASSLEVPVKKKSSSLRSKSPSSSLPVSVNRSPIQYKVNHHHNNKKIS